MNGPNERKLIAHKMSIDAIPPGGGLPEAIGVLTDKCKILAIAREATKWVREAIAVVKTAPDNPYGDDDEAIAGELLRRIDERKAAQRAGAQ